jgi:hypothetical protein
MKIVNVQMLKYSIAFIVLLALPFKIFSQSREMGVMLGVMNYKGDLHPQMYDTKNNRPAIGLLYRRSYSNHWAFKGALNYGHITADDADADDEFSRNRNLNFKSHILELTGQIEFNFFPYQTANPATKASPYLLAGFSVFHFNPKALYNGEYVELQPLGTEGQGTSANPDEKLYRRTSAAFVFGGGMKFKLGRRWGCTIESAVRKTYTDYVDDVHSTYADPNAIRVEYGKTAAILSDRSFSKAPGGNIGRQRGDTSQRDWYVFTGVQFTYTLSKHYIDSCRPFRIKLW